MIKCFGESYETWSMQKPDDNSTHCPIREWCERWFAALEYVENETFIACEDGRPCKKYKPLKASRYADD